MRLFYLTCHAVLVIVFMYLGLNYGLFPVINAGAATMTNCFWLGMLSGSIFSPITHAISLASPHHPADRYLNDEK